MGPRNLRQALTNLAYTAGITCGPMAAQALSGDPVQTGGVMAGGVLAFLVEKLGKTSEDLERKQVRLTPENATLSRLADVALREAIGEFRRHHDVAAWNEGLEFLEEGCDGFHGAAVEAAETAEERQTGMSNLAILALSGSDGEEWLGDGKENEAPWEPRPPEWPALIDELAGDDIFVAPFRDELARHLANRLPAITRELLAEDAAGRGPLEGRAWPAVQLQWQHDLRSLLGEIRTRLEDETDRAAELRELAESAGVEAERLDGLEKAIREAERCLGTELRRRIESLTREEWENQAELIEAIAAGDERLAESLERVEARLEAGGRLIRHLSDHAEALEKASVESLDSFEERMWEEWMAKTDVGGFSAEKLEILRRGPRGRDRELGEFEDFLADNEARVLYWKGWPGAGKTRLCLEMGQRARHRGWEPLYLSDRIEENPIRRLASTLQSFPEGGALLLFLDTSNRGIDRELVRRFYDLPMDHRAHTLKCICTSWPTYAELFAEPFEKHPWFRSRELGPVDAEGPFRDLLVKLGDGVIDSEDANRLIAAAEGTPLVAFLGLQQRIADPEQVEFETRHQILDGKYLQLIHDFLDDHPDDAESLLWGLRTLAMIRSVDRTDEHTRRCLKGSANGDLTGAIQKLAASGLLRRSSENRLDLTPDLFRIFVAKESCRGTSDRIRLYSGLAEWMEHAEGFLGPWLPEIWSITRQALPEDRHEELREALLSSADRAIEETDDRAEAARLGGGLFEATVIEDEPRRRISWADRIGALRSLNDSAEIALEEAKALANATVREPKASRRVELADQIKALRLLHNDTSEIALAEARAIVNATVGEPKASRYLELAKRIEALRLSHDTPEIALEIAKALMNATVVVAKASRRVELADRIGDLRSSHDTVEIAVMEASAVCNATAVEPEASRRVELADRIGDLFSAYPGSCQSIRQLLSDAGITDEKLKDELPEIRRVLEEHCPSG